jgi:hypothetical protein
MSPGGSGRVCRCDCARGQGEPAARRRVRRQGPAAEAARARPRDRRADKVRERLQFCAKDIVWARGLLRPLLARRPVCRGCAGQWQHRRLLRHQGNQGLRAPQCRPDRRVTHVLHPLPAQHRLVENAQRSPRCRRGRHGEWPRQIRSPTRLRRRA